MGTPAFAATILETLMRWEGGEVVGVFTQPDRPAGRGRKLRPSQVKQLAQARRLPVFQPEKLKSPEDQALVADLQPDVAVVAAYGLILPQAVLDIPRLGCVNVHASLLPKHRGAAPIQRSILAGDVTTGITIMQMEAGLDTGPMLSQRALGIGLEDSAATLHDQLADMGGKLLVETLEALEAGVVKPILQDDAKASYAAKLQKDEGFVTGEAGVLEVHNRVRAMYPWPGAFMRWQPETSPDGSHEGEPMKVGLAPGEIGPPIDAIEGVTPEPGQLIYLCDHGLALACTDRYYLLSQLTPENKKPMDARSFYNGYMNRAACQSRE